MYSADKNSNTFFVALLSECDIQVSYLKIFMDRVQLLQSCIATMRRQFTFNLLSANTTKWSNTLKQFLVNLTKGWKGGSTIEPPSDFEPGTSGLVIQRSYHEAISPKLWTLWKIKQFDSSKSLSKRHCP